MNQERKGILRENQKFYKKKDYTKAKTVMTGDSHLGFLIIKITPKMACQNIQSKNEPSWPSQ